VDEFRDEKYMKWLSAGEVAKKYHRPRCWVYRYIENRQVKFRKVKVVKEIYQVLDDNTLRGLAENTLKKIK